MVTTLANMMQTFYALSNKSDSVRIDFINGKAFREAGNIEYITSLKNYSRNIEYNYSGPEITDYNVSKYLWKLRC